MRPKSIGLVKEGIAADRLSDATAAAQVAEVYQFPKKRGGRDMSGEQAARIVAQVGLGKRSVLFRLAGRMAERGPLIEELSFILKKSGGRRGGEISFSMLICQLIATAACDELISDACNVCHGAGQKKLHEDVEGRQQIIVCPECKGARWRRFKDDDRIKKLAQVWAEPQGGAAGVASEAARVLREHRRLREVLFAIDVAKSVLLDSERIAAEETGVMAERWGRE